MNAARAVLVALLLCFSFHAAAVVAVPPLTGRVVDLTGTLSSGDAATLTQRLKDLEQRKGSQVAVLIVPTTDGEAIEPFSIRVAEAWKIGRRKVDDGALLVIAKNDRKLRIEVGYGLEGALNDVTAKRIIDEVITPKFRNGDFAGGISDGVDRIIRVIDGEKLPTPDRSDQHGGSYVMHFDPLNPFVIFGLFVAATIFRSLLGRLLGAVATAGLAAAVIWFAIGVVLLAGLAGVIVFVLALMADLNAPSGRRGSGGWSGSGGSYSGGSSSSSSSDSGSFSGGGGSFGGGGASGSW
jgi:uncharacterized protein